VIRWIPLLTAVLVACQSASTTPKAHLVVSLGENPPGQRWLDPDASLGTEAFADGAQVLMSEAVAPGDRLTARAQVPGTNCVLLPGRTSPGLHDVDLLLFAEDGTELLADELPDARPTLLLCPPRPSNVYVVARAVSGRGMLAVGTELIPLAQANSVRSRLGLDGTGRRSSPRTDLDAMESFVAHQRTLAVPLELTKIRQLPVDSAHPTVVGLTVPSGRCLDLLAIPDADIFGVDVELVDEDGETVGRMGLSGPERFSLVCAHTLTTVNLLIRPQVGRGMLNLFVSQLDAHHAPRVGSHRIEVGGTVELDREVEERSATLLNRGYLRTGTPLSYDLATGQVVALQFSPLGTCRHFEFFAETPARGIKSRYFSKTGELLAESSGHDHSTLTLCPGAEGRLEGALTGRGGRLMIMQWQIPSLLAPSLPSGPAFSQMVGVFESLGLDEPLRSALQAERVTLARSTQWRRSYQVKAGTCISAICTVDQMRLGVRVTLRRSEAASEMSSVQQSRISSSRLCVSPHATTPATVELSLSSEATQATGLLAVRFTDLPEDTDRD
jgi:hypothetical protein